ncbi:retrotransposable element Tf2, partial [Tanacetum coccineum]
KVISAKAGEKFKKAQDAEMQVHKRQHTEKVKRLRELNKKRVELYKWTISSRLKPEPIRDVKIHLNSKLEVLIYRNNDKRNFVVYNPFKFADFGPTELDELFCSPYSVPEQAPSQSSGRKRKHMELEPKIKVPGLECKKSLHEGVPFVNNMVIEEPEYRIFFTDVFSDQAFQRWNDIHKVGLDSLKDAFESMVQELLDAGVIRHNQRPFSSPIVMVKKKDGKLIDELCGSKVFSKLDLRSGHHQIRMYPDDIAKTAFQTHQGHYEFIVMPFGLTNAPSTFQSLMNQVFKPFLRKFTLVFFDDILVYSPDMKSHTKHVRMVLQTMSYPLTKLLRKNAFVWNNEAKQSIEKLKEAMMVALVLKLPNFEEDFMVETDAFGEGIGVVLQQQALIARLKSRKDCAKQYSWSNNLFTIKGKLVVDNDNSLKNDLIDYFHARTIEGHSGVKVTTHSMCLLLYWKKIRKHVKQFVNECSVYQLNKADLAASPGLMQPFPIPLRVWSEVSMDFIDGLPASRWKTVILVVVDKLSKYSYFMPLTDLYSAIQVAQAFLENIYKLHGLPKVIVSDIDKTRVVNRCLEGFLRCMTGERPKEWVHWLPLAEYWNVDVVDRSMTARKYVISLLKFHLERSHVRMKNMANKKRSEREFELSDWVYVKLQPYRKISMRKGRRYKLSPKFYGPYQIIARISKVAYRLNLPANSKIHPVFYVSQLKAHRGNNPNTQQALPMRMI